MTDIQAAKQKLEQAQKEYQQDVAKQREVLVKQRDEIDRQIAEIDTLSGNQARPSGKRRTGIRQEVRNCVMANEPIAPAEIRAKLNLGDDASAKQAVSNALGALKKKGDVISADGKYKIERGNK